MLKNLSLKENTNLNEFKFFGKEMFKGQTGNEKEFQIYAQLEKIIKIVASSKKINGLIICGPPGTGKTYVVRRTLYFNDYKYFYAKGDANSVSELFRLMFEYSNDIIVMDDFDIEWTKVTMGFIKAVTDTSSKRMISNPSTETSVSQNEENLPENTIFTGKVFLLTNKGVSDIPPAIKSRVPVIVVDFNVKQLVQLICNMLKYLSPDVSINIKQEVLDFSN